MASTSLPDCTMQKIRSFIKLIRVHQWVKNLFIFLPSFFALKILPLENLLHLSLTFIAFSLLASAVYVFNDWMDISSDKIHPVKRNRPLASGKVSPTEGLLLILGLLALSAALFLYIDNQKVMFFSAVYLVQNILYSIKLKHIAILDIMLIAIGFVIRLLIGGAVTETPLSHWIILMTLVLALFLALAKRRDDVFNFTRTGEKARKNLQGYNMDFLNVAITIMATVVIVCYIMYCVSPEITAKYGDQIYLTSFFVILGVLRYLQLTFVWLISGSPTAILLKNHFLQLILVGWIVSFFLIIYLKI